MWMISFLKLEVYKLNRIVHYRSFGGCSGCSAEGGSPPFSSACSSKNEHKNQPHTSGQSLIRPENVDRIRACIASWSCRLRLWRRFRLRNNDNGWFFFQQQFFLHVTFRASTLQTICWRSAEIITSISLWRGRTEGHRSLAIKGHRRSREFSRLLAARTEWQLRI